MLTIKYQTTFKKDYKRIKKRGYDTKRLEVAIDLLAAGKKLPAEYKEHNLSGDYAGCRECHIASDWLLVYEVKENELLLYLMRTGTHSDIF
jgi:mRNA interferase YafQ